MIFSPNSPCGRQNRIATTATLFTDPWNPVNGANWVTSAFVQAAVDGNALMPDPYTGLRWPWFAERAELVAQAGLPIATNLDWVDLTFQDSIEVPAEAWADWDPVNQKWITVAEKFPDGTTAKTMSVIYYPADLFEKVKWHDGNNLSLADSVLSMIELFDYGTEGSAIYDEDQAANLQAYLTHFKGVQILSTDPLTIATWDDNYYADAELDITTLALAKVTDQYLDHLEAMHPHLIAAGWREARHAQPLVGGRTGALGDHLCVVREHAVLVGVEEDVVQRQFGRITAIAAIVGRVAAHLEFASGNKYAVARRCDGIRGTWF